MAASFTIADRNNGFTKADTPAATLASMAAYREAMADFAAMGTLDIWMPTWTRTSPYRGSAAPPLKPRVPDLDHDVLGHVVPRLEEREHRVRRVVLERVLPFVPHLHEHSDVPWPARASGDQRSTASTNQRSCWTASFRRNSNSAR
jgi:hypothetical protein